MGWRTGQSYSQDLRDRVLAAVDGGMAVRQAAVLYRVSIAYIYKALARRRRTGESGINPGRGHAPRKLTAEQEVALDARVRSQPGITLVQAQDWLEAEHGVRLSIAGLWTTAKRLGLSFKKSPARRRAGQARRGRPAQAVESLPALHRS